MVLLLVFCQSGDQSAGQHIFDLARRKAMSHSKRRILGDVVDLQGVLVGQRGTKTRDVQRVVLVNAVVVVGIVELERQNSEVGQILPVDAGKRLGDDSPKSKVTWCDRRVFARGALAVVVTADDDVAGLFGLLCPFRVR